MYLFRRSMIALLLIVVYSACKQRLPETLPAGREHAVLLIRPLGIFDTTLLHNVSNRLLVVCPTARLLPWQELPDAAYYAPRNRYRADDLLRFLSLQAGFDTVMLGITARDISTTKAPHPDWGIMGLGYNPGKACVVSTYRLNRQHLEDQLFRLCLHELGHTQGLPHCAAPHCLMQDAAGHNHLDQLDAFCPYCIHRLQNSHLFHPGT